MLEWFRKVEELWKDAIKDGLVWISPEQWGKIVSHRVITVISNVNKHLAANCTFVLDFKLGKVDLRGHDRIKCCGFGRAIQF